MDIARATDYLNFAMLRRLLTCLALITGLAATGAPASAAVVEALSQQVSDGTCAVEPGKDQRCDCVVRKDSQPSRAQAPQGCKPRKPIVIYIPTVQLGPDRARE